jgi:hypothetical protein
MASEAQVEANRRNAQKSTGPKTESGKARARLNSLKHGETAKTVTPVLPQEDPKDLVSRIQQWVDYLEPQKTVERELTSRAARLSWALDRADRYETAHLSRRVRKAQMKLSGRRMEQVYELGRKLLYNTGKRSSTWNPEPPWDDNPAAFLRGLEEIPEGCRWLLDRWVERRNLVDRQVPWNKTDLFKLIRLRGNRAGGPGVVRCQRLLRAAAAVSIGQEPGASPDARCVGQAAQDSAGAPSGIWTGDSGIPECRFQIPEGGGQAGAGAGRCRSGGCRGS